MFKIMEWILALGLILIFISILLGIFLDDSGMLCSAVTCFGFICVVGTLVHTPTAMDYHAGKAVIKYEIVDSVKVDSVIVFRDGYND